MGDEPPMINELDENDKRTLEYRILSVKGVGDVWYDDHVPCRSVLVRTVAGEVTVSLWWCGDVAYLVDVANESPTAMAAVLHKIYSDLYQ